MNLNAAYDVLYVGNYTKDTIVSPTGVRYVDGGAVNYAAHAAARLGLRVAVVTHLAKEDDRVVEKFSLAGVDCFARYTTQSTCVRLEYPTLDPDIRTLSVTSTAGSITYQEIEGVHSRAAVIGTSFRGEVGLDVIRAFRERGIILAADAQGFVRVLRGESLIYESWDEMAPVLGCLDVFKADSTESEFLTGEKDIRKAARIFAELGPREIVLTHKDGVLVYADGQYFEFGFYPQNLNGRSGRGDTCIGIYVAMRLSKTPDESGKWAAAVTSLKMETLGPFSRSVQDVEALIRDKYQYGSDRNETATD
jgi:sugar/nucleoside kinase (ribokinase family)